MARRLVPSRLPILAAALAAGGCDSSSPLGPNPSTGSAISLIVSDPARVAQVSGSAVGAEIATSLHANEGAAYVSAEPGTVGIAATVEIENLRLEQSTLVPLADGGFDPVAIPAVVGDSIEFRFNLAAGGVTAVRAAVPARRRPRVVRTHPTRGRRDVAINSVITTVFSEPIDRTTLRDSTVRLLRDGVAVAGAIRLAAGSTLGVEFVPAQPLDPATTYRLVLDGRIRDLSGEPLETPEPVEFTTFGEGGTSSLTVITRTGGTDAPDGYDVFVDGRFAARIGATDTIAIGDLGAGGHHVLLGGIGDYCFATGGVYRQATVTASTTGTVAYDITCTDLPEVSLEVTTSGVDVDMDGYDVLVNGERVGSVPASGSLDLTQVRYGPNVVELAGIRANCAIGGVVRRFIEVEPGAVDTLTFGVTCTPDFIPQGVIAYAAYGDDYRSSIYTSNADGSGRVRLTNGDGYDRLPAWSPDGGRLAFVRTHVDGSSGLYLIDADGSNLEAHLIGTGQEFQSLSWSHDGRQLIFSAWQARDWSAPGIHAVDIASGAQARYIQREGSGGGLIVSPSRSELAYRSGVGLKVINLHGEFVRQIAVDNPGGSLDVHAWSPDGGTISVMRCRARTGGGCDMSLDFVSMSGSVLTSIPLPNSLPRSVTSRDGIVAFSSFSEAGIAYLRADGRGTSVTIGDAFDPAWKP